MSATLRCFRHLWFLPRSAMKPWWLVRKSGKHLTNPCCKDGLWRSLRNLKSLGEKDKWKRNCWFYEKLRPNVKTSDKIIKTLPQPKCLLISFSLSIPEPRRSGSKQSKGFCPVLWYPHIPPSFSYCGKGWRMGTRMLGPWETGKRQLGGELWPHRWGLST